jgi:hypothetical protein
VARNGSVLNIRCVQRIIFVSDGGAGSAWRGEMVVQASHLSSISLLSAVESSRVVARNGSILNILCVQRILFVSDGEGLDQHGEVRWLCRQPLQHREHVVGTAPPAVAAGSPGGHLCGGLLHGRQGGSSHACKVSTTRIF